jgi:hypothetical protein
VAPSRLHHNQAHADAALGVGKSPKDNAERNAKGKNADANLKNADAKGNTTNKTAEPSAGFP